MTKQILYYGTIVSVISLNRIRKEIEFQKTRDYFYLDLPMETERYVYKIAVAKIILSNPGEFGFYLEEKEYVKNTSVINVLLCVV